MIMPRPRKPSTTNTCPCTKTKNRRPKTSGSNHGCKPTTWRKTKTIKNKIQCHRKCEHMFNITYCLCSFYYISMRFDPFIVILSYCFVTRWCSFVEKVSKLPSHSRSDRLFGGEFPPLVLSIPVIAPGPTVLAVVVHWVGFSSPPHAVVKHAKEFVGVQDGNARISAQIVSPVDAQTRAGNLNPGIDLFAKKRQLTGGDFRRQDDKTLEVVLLDLIAELGQKSRVPLPSQSPQNNSKDSSVVSLLLLLDLESSLFNSLVSDRFHFQVVIAFLRERFGVGIVAIKLGNLGVGYHCGFQVKASVGNKQDHRSVLGYWRVGQDGRRTSQDFARRQRFGLRNR
mmetsp:Transcript_11575/g.29304  ORF Transcript_11575/g.29304 Transcript_11575/m.29304 type:complete len:339 (-) Transcript_11575:452-1468(-)